MKKALIVASSLLVMLAGLSAQADSSMTATTPSAAPAMTGGPSMSGSHPCKKIADACEAAGFMKGGEASGKGLMKNCLKPIMDGKTVTGVTVSASDVSACQAKHAARQH